MIPRNASALIALALALAAAWPAGPAASAPPSPDAQVPPALGEVLEALGASPAAGCCTAVCVLLSCGCCGPVAACTCILGAVGDCNCGDVEVA